MTSNDSRTGRPAPAQAPAAPESVRVLNGVVRIGDTVALAVRDGNLAAIRYGEVTDFEMRKNPYGPEYLVRLKLRVEKSSADSQLTPNRIVGTEKLDRVVLVKSRIDRDAQASAASLKAEAHHVRSSS
jgi:hypothetical protein